MIPLTDPTMYSGRVWVVVMALPLEDVAVRAAGQPSLAPARILDRTVSKLSLSVNRLEVAFRGAVQRCRRTGRFAQGGRHAGAPAGPGVPRSGRGGARAARDARGR